LDHTSLEKQGKSWLRNKVFDFHYKFFHYLPMDFVNLKLLENPAVYHVSAVLMRNLLGEWAERSSAGSHVS
jgi:hypothetical protein